MAEPDIGPGSHFVLYEPGPYLFPDLFKYESLENSGTLLFLRVFTTKNQRLWVPISYPAARSLVVAEQKEVPLETMTGVRPLRTVGMADPVEMPLLDRFVCFRGIKPDWRLCEFMTDDCKSVYFSCSAELYRALIRALKKRWPSPFAGRRNVFGTGGMPCHERRLTSQEGVWMAAQTSAYHKGVKPEQVMQAWSQMHGTPEEKREIWNRFWAERGIDLNAPKPRRSTETVEKFLRRLDPHGKVTFIATRICPRCEWPFSTKNKKKKYCSDACEAVVVETNRPEDYHADYQRERRNQTRDRLAVAAKAQRKAAAKKHRRCDFCGTLHSRKSLYCGFCKGGSR